jgi:hypothetical protein
MKTLTDQLWTSTSFEEAWNTCIAHHCHHQSIAWRYVKEMARKNDESAAGIPLEEWPLLPISGFRERLISITSNPEVIFKSSGTSSSVPSSHAISDLSFYHKVSVLGFMSYYRDAFQDGARFIGYVPGYIDNPYSSLISMIGAICTELGDMARMISTPSELRKALDQDSTRPVVLFGAAFGLLDIVDQESESVEHAVRLPKGSILIETGGMKTHRRELSRDEMHAILSDGFGVPKSHIHSEYGMCEMTSQAYSTDGVWFTPTPLARFVVKEMENPLQTAPIGTSGRLGILDAGNSNSCPWFLTDDVAIQREDGAIQLLGRRDKAVSRGCNYMVDVDG